MRYGLKAAILAGVFCLAPDECERAAEGGTGDHLLGLLFQNSPPIEETPS